MNQKFCQVYSTLLSLFVVVIPSINCHQNSKISVCPGEGKLSIKYNQIINTKILTFIIRDVHEFLPSTKVILL